MYLISLFWLFLSLFQTVECFESIENVISEIHNDQGIAIDIGARNGIVSLSLADRFWHVIAVDVDAEIFENFPCKNVTFCPNGLSNTSADGSITLKQMIYHYVFDNSLLNKHPISFINCDIDGREENILEDLLHFAFHNKCKVLIKFDVEMWKSKTISDFEYLFEHFKTFPENISQRLCENPNEIVFFEPLKEKKSLIKKNMTAVIIGYNQYTFIRNMVKQLEKYTSDIVIIDNASTFKKLLDYYQNEYPYTLLKQKENHGHMVYHREPIQKLLGNHYILTDPDLLFNPKLPDNFIDVFLELSNFFGVNKVGFALCIKAKNLRKDLFFSNKSLMQWEKQFWKQKLAYAKDPSLQLYSAHVDTTFCLVNKTFPHHSIRVAGDYTCFHIPWHKNFRKQLEEGEFESYLINNKSTNWFK